MEQPNMTTVNISKESYAKLGDLAYINKTSRKGVIDYLVREEYEKKSESISKIKAIVDSEKEAINRTTLNSGR